MTRYCRILIAAVAILGSADRSAAAQAPTGQSRSLPTTPTYTFLIGSGFLCEPGDTSMCPAKVRGNSGASYEMSGAGTFDVQSKSVKAAGTYNHRSLNGNVLETGVWIASELVTFDSYGTAQGALRLQGSAFGPEQYGFKRFPMLSGSMPTGGLAVFRIRLLPAQGSPTIAVLQVNCSLGDVPRERSVEGIRLTLEGNKFEFLEEVSGRVMFLSIRPGLNAPTQAPQRDAWSETSEQPQK